MSSHLRLRSDRKIKKNRLCVLFLIIFLSLGFISLTRLGYSQTGTRTNGIWCHYEDLDAQFWADLVNGNIDQAFIDTGEWNSAHGIDYFLTQNEINNFVGAAHANGIDAVAWVHYRYPEDYYKIDIRGSTNQSLMADAVLSCLAKGFDGFEDDLEPFEWAGQTVNIIGDYDDYIDYLNAIGTAAHGVGKTCYAAINIGYNNPAVEDIFDQVTELDAAKVMLYNGGTYSQGEMLDVLGTVFNVPPNIDIMCGLITPLANPISYINNIKPSLPTFNTYVTGYGLFEYATMSGTDWANWNSWTPKNDQPGPTPTPSPTATPTPTPVPTLPPTIPPRSPYPSPTAGVAGGYNTDNELDTLLFLAGGAAVFILTVTFALMLKGKGK